ncbi:MAG: hypothetical protein ACFFKA_05935 [Candidatus Thorarchaeota archaeon]
MKKDYVVLSCLAKGYNREDPKSRKNLLKVAEIFNRSNPINMIPKFTWRISPIITSVYDDIDNVKKVVESLKKEHLGVSIVISGLIPEVKALLSELGLNMHTIHLSLGVFGKKDLLPKNQHILEITTMCGHHCISPQSVEYYLKLVKEGKITVEKAARYLAKPCVCGIFNISRAIDILSKLMI